LSSGKAQTPFSFHEIRGLSITMLVNAGFTDEEIAEVTAHESVKTTQGYQNPDDLSYMPVHIQIENL
jgi:integrase